MMQKKYQGLHDDIQVLVRNLIPEGLRELFISGKLKVCGAESAELRKRIDQERVKRREKLDLFLEGKGPEPKDEKYTLTDSDRREDEVLRIITKGWEPLSVVLYGGLHDFRASIKRWNAEHPEKKVSLIVITPDAYAKLQGKK